MWARVDRRCIFIWSDNVSCVKLNALCSCHAHLLRIVKHWELCCIINCWTRFLIKKKVNIDIHCLLKKSIVLVARHTKTYYLCLPTLRWTALEQQGNECNACYCLSQFLFAAFFFSFKWHGRCVLLAPITLLKCTQLHPNRHLPALYVRIPQCAKHAFQICDYLFFIFCLKNSTAKLRFLAPDHKSPTSKVQRHFTCDTSYWNIHINIYKDIIYILYITINVSICTYKHSLWLFVVCDGGLQAMPVCFYRTL